VQRGQAAVEGDSAAGGFGPAFGAGGGVETGGSESGSQGGVCQEGLDGQGEAVWAGWGDQQATFAVRDDLGEVAHVGCDNGSAESARGEKEAAGRGSSVRQDDDVGGAEVGGEARLGEEAQIQDGAIQESEGVGLGKDGSGESVKGAGLVEGGGGDPVKGVELVTVRSERLVRFAGDDEAGVWAMRGNGAERLDQIGQPFVRLDQPREEHQFGVQGQAKPLPGYVALDGRVSFQEWAVRDHGDTVGGDAPALAEGHGAALTVDDQRVGRAVQVPVMRDVGWTCVVGDEIVGGVDQRNAEGTQAAPEQEIELRLDGPLDVDHVGPLPSDLPENREPVQGVFGGLQRTADKRLTAEAEARGERGAGDAEESLVNGDGRWRVQVFVQEPGGEQIDAAAGGGQRLTQRAIVRRRVGVRIDHQDVKGTVCR
jgi:hypothetical protein